MIKVSHVVLLGGVVVLSLIAPCAAHTQPRQPRLVNAECDSVVIGGVVRTLVRFAIQAPASDGVCEFVVENLDPDPLPDSCRVLAGYPPPGWSYQIRPEDGAIIWICQTDFASPGELQAGFGVALVGFGCCYRVRYYDVFNEVFADEAVCFDCSPQVPAQSGTWGRLKVNYR